MKFLKEIKVIIILLSVLVLFDACQDCQDNCPTNSTCIDNVCVCNDGYSGVNCETFDLCIDTVCPENAVCVNGVCVCEAGFSGIDCDQTDPCILMICPENAICDNGNCVCEEGYTFTEYL